MPALPMKGSSMSADSEARAALLPTSSLSTAAGPSDTPHPTETPSDVRRDMDHLVKEIKENLKLGYFYQGGGGGGKLRSSRSVPSHLARHRGTPYAVPPTSRLPGIVSAADDDLSTDTQDNRDEKPSQLKRWNHRRRYPSTCLASKDPDNPFQMLQELITDGSLIKEAVRRLQLGLTPKYSYNTFYDSDDECRTPPAFPHLCCEI